jgi:hypothetical protein
MTADESSRLLALLEDITLAFVRRVPRHTLPNRRG